MANNNIMFFQNQSALLILKESKKEKGFILGSFMGLIKLTLGIG